MADLATGLAGLINAAQPAVNETPGKLVGLWRARNVDVEAVIAHARSAGHNDPVAHILKLAATAPWMTWTRPGAGTAKWLSEVVPGLLDGEIALTRSRQAQPKPQADYGVYVSDAVARVQRGENRAIVREVLTYALSPETRSDALAAFDAAVPVVETGHEPASEPDSYDNRFEDPEPYPDLELGRYDCDNAGDNEQVPSSEPDSYDNRFEDPEPYPDLDLGRYEKPGVAQTPIQRSRRKQPEAWRRRLDRLAAERLARLAGEESAHVARGAS